MRIFDISQAISAQTAVWPGDPPVDIRRLGGQGPDGADGAVSLLWLGTHTATHVDPPSHFYTGAATVDELPLDVLLGPAWVVQLPGRLMITGRMLQEAGIPEGIERLLIGTDNSRRRGVDAGFKRDFIALAGDAADWLLRRGMRLVGIDGPSIEAFSAAGDPIHRALLAAGVVVVEGLELRDVPAGPYSLCCLPLRIAGGDGAPARAILWSSDEPSGA